LWCARLSFGSDSACRRGASETPCCPPQRAARTRPHDARDAAISGVPPVWSCRSPFAACQNSQLRCCRLAKNYRHPLPSSSFTTSRWPSALAIIRALWPQSSVASRCAAYGVLGCSSTRISVMFPATWRAQGLVSACSVASRAAWRGVAARALPCSCINEQVVGCRVRLDVRRHQLRSASHGQKAEQQQAQQALHDQLLSTAAPSLICLCRPQNCGPNPSSLEVPTSQTHTCGALTALFAVAPIKGTRLRTATAAPFRGALTLVVDVVREHAGVRLTAARHQAREAGALPLRGRARRRAQHDGQLTDYSAGQSSQVCVPAVVVRRRARGQKEWLIPLWENYGRTSHSQSWSTPKTFVT